MHDVEHGEGQAAEQPPAAADKASNKLLALVGMMLPPVMQQDLCS